MEKWQEFEDIDNSKEEKHQPSKTKLKGIVSSIKKNNLWLGGRPVYSENHGLSYILLNSKSLFDSLTKATVYSKNEIIPFQNYFATIELNADLISHTQRRIHKLISFNKKQDNPIEDESGLIKRWQQQLEIAKYLHSIELTSFNRLKQLLKDPTQTNLEELIPWLEIELNTEFINNLQLTPSEYLLKYSHLHQQKLEKIFHKKKFSKATDLFILSIINKTDSYYPETSYLKNIRTLIPDKYLTELIFFSQLPEFNFKDGKKLCYLLAENPVLYDYYKAVKHYFIDSTALSFCVNTLNEDFYELKDIPDDFKAFIVDILKNIFIIFRSSEIIQSFLSYIIFLNKTDLENEPDNYAFRYLIRHKILIILFNITFIHLIKQNPRQYINNLDLGLSYIKAITPELFRLNDIKEGKEPSFKDQHFHYDILSIFNFLLEMPQRITEDLAREIFKITEETNYVDAYTIFPAWAEVVKLGTPQTKKLIKILKTLKNLSINYENIFDILANEPESINLDIFDYILEKRGLLPRKDFDFLLNELYMSDFFDKEVKALTANRFNLIDWLVDNISSLIEDEDTCILEFLIDIYYVINQEDKPIRYLDRMKKLPLREIFENIYLGTAKTAFKLAYLSEKYTDTNLIQLFKLLINNLELRNSLENLNKIFSNEEIIQGLFKIYDTSIIETYTRQFFYQVKDLSYLPKKTIKNIFNEAFEIIEEANILDIKTNKDINEIIKLYGKTPPMISLLFSFQKANNKEPELPKRFVKKVLYKYELKKELFHLTKIKTKSVHISKRINNLQSFLSKNETYPEDKVLKRLIHYVNEEKFSFMKRQIANYFSIKFTNVFNFPPPEPINDDYKNALLMYNGTRYNRKLLRKLIEDSRYDIYGWQTNHPLNFAYIEKIRNKKTVDIDKWVSGHRKRFDNVFNKIPFVSLYTELNPLKILQMGNYFNTCLSVGASFSYAAIANACEINKHVIFAEDYNGEIIARQLVCLSDNGEIVTFEIYNRSSFEIEPLFIIFNKEFATLCNTKIGKDCSIENIMTPNWYDDGIICLPGLIDDADTMPFRKFKKKKKKALR